MSSFRGPVQLDSRPVRSSLNLLRPTIIMIGIIHLLELVENIDFAKNHNHVDRISFEYVGKIVLCSSDIATWYCHVVLQIHLSHAYVFQ